MLRDLQDLPGNLRGKQTFFFCFLWVLVLVLGFSFGLRADSIRQDRRELICGTEKKNWIIDARGASHLRLSTETSGTGTPCFWRFGKGWAYVEPPLERTGFSVSMNCCRVEDRRFQGSFLAVIDRPVLDGLPEYTKDLGPQLNMDNADCTPYRLVIL